MSAGVKPLTIKLKGNNMKLTEKYRPAKLADVLGQDKIIDQLRNLDKADNLGGQAYYLSGKSGTGKTTIARIIARRVADCRFTIDEVVARQLSPNQLKDIADKWRMLPLYGKGFALIVNESHGLSKPVIEIFLDVLENMPEYVTVIFTTTIGGNDLFEDHVDAGPFKSRCLLIQLGQRNLAPVFAAKCKEIAGIENLDCQPLDKYIRLAQDCGNNMREMLNRIELGEMKQ